LLVQIRSCFVCFFPQLLYVLFDVNYMMYFFLGAVNFYLYLKTYKNKVKTKSKKVHFIIYVKKCKQELEKKTHKSRHNGRMDLI